MSRQPSLEQQELAAAVAVGIRTVMRKLKRHLPEGGEKDELTLSQVSVVLRLEENGPWTASRLARAEGMRPQSMSALIADLQESGLVRGTPDPSDGRQTLMSLTPKCLKWLKEGRAARQDWLTQRIGQRLSLQEQQELRTALVLMSKLVDE